MSYEFQQTDLLIYKAVLGDNWDLVRRTFLDNPDLRTKTINSRLETPLMVAVGTNQSHHFVKNLLDSLMTTKGLLISHVFDALNDEGDTAFHYGAKVGNTIDTILLVRRVWDVTHRLDPMTPIRDLSKAFDAISKGSAFMLYSASHIKKKEMLDLLLSATDEVPGCEIHHSLTSIVRVAQSFFGNDLIIPAINAERLDVALKQVEKYSHNAVHRTWNAQRPLHALATKPELFLSERKVGFWASKILNINNIKTRHRQAKELLKRICDIVIKRSDHDKISAIFGSTIATAVAFGNHEVIEECIFAYPSIIWTNIEGFSWLHEVIKQRQEKIYNLVYQMSSYKVFLASRTNGDDENVLHIAAKLAPSHQLSTITGAALQMQRELKWFEEINNFVGPLQREALNAKGKTPGMVFTDEHTELLKQGQKWMKGTASSSTVIATLIVTVAFAGAFAAVFKLPVGEENKRKITFMIFITSDAIALFSSAASVLMFLGILTLRYAEKDFLYTLPRRLTIGLVCLFVSLAATMIAFTATLVLVLQDEVPWVAAPLGMMATILVVVFSVLQFPLLMDLANTSYAQPIFGKQNERIIH
ncbi:hypothetical protein OSB04_010286 [Centaurea solstitialis]|uniref:PGG domain-containing protein n=1 Tax=Centaurea solstitialis TaxID=347529 RepID=A0AA38TQC1_9ASTR|nr:hypothetical protein OSB04_010286 [Centaurea solstitialis]